MIKWMQNLTGGIDQGSDPTLSNEGNAILLKNVTNDQTGNWSTRRGIEGVGANLSSTDQGRGLFAYDATDGTHKLLAVIDQDLKLYDEGAGSWSNVVTDEWPAATAVNGVNFLNRLYLGSADGGTPLAYTTGSSLTDVTPLIGGHILGVSKEVMAVGGNDIMPNLIILSDPFTDKFYAATSTVSSVGSDTITVSDEVFESDMEDKILYNTTDGTMALIVGFTDATTITIDRSAASWSGDTVYVLKNTFIQDNACTGLVVYNEDFISWDERKMYIWDPLGGFLSIKNFGNVNPRVAKAVGQYVVFVNREGIGMYLKDQEPVDITPKIRDEVNRLALWDLVDPANFSTMCAGVEPHRGIYHLSVGTLRTVAGAPASGTANAVFVLDTKSGNWYLRSYPERIVEYTTFIDQGGKQRLYGITDSGNVYKIHSDTSGDEFDDDVIDSLNQSISVEVRTMHHMLGNPTVTQHVSGYYAKYTAENEVVVAASANRGDYEETGTLPAASSVTVLRVNSAPQLDGFSHSIKFTTTGKFVLEAYGFDYQDNNSTGEEDY